MTEVYDTPWDMAIEFLEDMKHSKADVKVLETYAQQDRNSQGKLFPVLHIDEDDYGIVLDTSPKTSSKKFQGHQAVKFEGKLSPSYNIEDEIQDVTKYKRNN